MTERIWIPTGSELVEQPRIEKPMPARGDSQVEYNRNRNKYRSEMRLYDAHLRDLTRYTINPSDWAGIQEVKEGEFEVVNVNERQPDGSYKIVSIAIPKRKEQGQEEMWIELVHAVIDFYGSNKMPIEAAKYLSKHYTLTKK